MNTPQTFNPQTPRITITAAAETYLKRYIGEAPDAKGLRLSTQKTGCSGYMYVSELMNEITESDIAAVSNTKLDIFMAQKSIPFLNGLTIDLENKQLGQKKLIYINPNESAKCGCGESFSIQAQRKSDI